MANSPYNGYSWAQREAILHALKLAIAKGYQPRRGACDMCGDPERETALHSEDYSEPYTFVPPETYLLCKACHLRLHKRFGEPPENWALFLCHLRSGGYGAEFTKRYTLLQRRAWQDALARGEPVELPAIRARRLDGPQWWEIVSLNPESLIAAWARPRPLRLRPTIEQYQEAIKDVRPSDKEIALLRCHAKSPNRSASMRDLAKGALQSDNVATANLVYGSFAKRLCEAMPTWLPDQREDGSYIWMSLLAEGWQPENREFEWVLVPPLAKLYG